MLYPFWLAGTSRSIEQEERIFTVHRLKRTLVTLRIDQIIVGVVTPLYPFDRFVVTLDYEYRLDTLTALLERLIYHRLEHIGLAFTVGSVSSDDKLRLGIFDTVFECLSREAAKDDRVDRPDTCTRQHRIGSFRDHRHIEYDTVPLLDTKLIFEQVRHLVDALAELIVGDMLHITLVPLKEDRRLLSSGCEVSVDTLVGDIHLAVGKPLVKRGIRLIEYLLIGLKPLYLLIGIALPETLIVLFGTVLQLPVLLHRIDTCIFCKFGVGIVDLF